MDSRPLRHACRFSGALLLFLLAGTTTLAAQSRRVSVIASDYRLVAPEDVPSGLVTFNLVNRGPGEHQLAVHRLPEGVAMADFVKEVRASPARRFEYTSIGGPETPADTGQTTAVTVELRPGRYVLACFRSSGDPSHFARGMYRQLVVRPVSRFAVGRPPLPDALVKLKAGAVYIERAFRAGFRVLEIDNVGPQVQSLLVGKLDSGRTIDDVVRWHRDSKGARPYKYLGGVTPMSPGRTAHLVLRFERGEHFILTAEREARSTRFHYEKAGVRRFTVN